MANIFLKHIRNIGLWLVYTGLSVIIGCYLFMSGNINIPLYCSLLLVITGIAVHVIIRKKDSKY